MNTPSSTKTALLVLGMHRSGTSALTRVLSLLGAELPSKLMQPVAGNNDLGFWEPQEVFEFNENLLSSLDSCWDDWRKLPDPESSNNTRGIASDQQKILAENYASAPLIVVKDPRLSRLLPWWELGFSAAGYEQKCVLALRHPLEISESLEVRNGFSTHHTLLVWLRHTLDAELHSRRHPRAVTHYPDLINNWSPELNRVSDQLSIRWPHAQQDASDGIEAFLSSSHRHHDHRVEELESDPRVSRWVQNAYSHMLELRTDPTTPEVLEALDKLREEFDFACESFGDEWYTSEQLYRRSQRSLQSLDASFQKTKRALSRSHDLRKSLADEVSLLKQQVQQLGSQHTQLQADLTRLEGKNSTLHRRCESLKNRSARQKKRIEQLEHQAREKRQEHSKAIALGRRERELLKQANGIMRPTLSGLGPTPTTSGVTAIAHCKQIFAGVDSLGMARSVVAQVRHLTKSPLFDERWYLQNNPDVRNAGVHPLTHWLMNGWEEGRDPNPWFESSWYLNRYPDVRAEQCNPLWHWVHHGARERRQPALFFDTPWYLQKYPDVERAKVDPLAHFIEYGRKEGRDFSPWFDSEWFSSRFGTSSAEAFPLYRRLANTLPIGPNAYFDADWYLEQHPNAGSSGYEAFVHYILEGIKNGNDPNPHFDAAWYAAQHPTAHSNPLLHYIEIGANSGHDPAPQFSVAAYLEQHPKVAEQGFPALQHYLSRGRFDGWHPPERASSPVAPQLATLDRLAEPAQQFEGERPHNEEWPTILLCAHSSSRTLFGGERSFIDILELQRHLSVNVQVAIPHADPEYLALLTPLATKVFVVPYGYWRAESEPDQLALSQLRSIIVVEKIRLVHVNTIVALEPSMAAMSLGVPVVTHVRESVEKDQWISELVGLPPAPLIRHVISRSSAIVANSRHSAKEFHKQGATFVVPNSFDLQALDIPNVVDPDCIYVGLISSNLPKKGIEDFALLAEECRQKLPNLRFRLIGPENEHTEDLKRRLQIGQKTPNLEFVGYQSSPIQAIKLVNIVLNLSHFAESFGRTIAEGLAARRPAVVYRLGAPKDLIVEGESGFSVETGKWDCIVPILARWAQDPQTIPAMGEKGRTSIATHYSRERAREALGSAYQGVLPQVTEGGPNCRIDHVARSDRYNIAPPPLADTLRVAYFCWHFPVPSETFVLNELRELKQQGIDVIVYCRHSPHREFSPDFEITWKTISDAEDLARQLQNDGRNIVHAHFVYPTVTKMVWPACNLLGLPFTFIAHAQDIFRFENDKLNQVGLISQDPLCRAVFVLGTFHRRYLIDRGVPEDKIVINPNAVNVEQFPFRAGEKTSSTRKICAIHRLTEKKGLRYLLDSARILQDANFDVEINIYGYGDEADALAENIRKLELTNTHLRGELKGPAAVQRVLSEHDAFIAPSVRAHNGDMDGIPTSIVEAMAAGVPVITTNIASIPDLVKDRETGLIVPPREPQALAKAIRRLYAMPKQALKELKAMAREKAISMHDTRRLTNRLIRIWSDTPIDIVIVSWNNLPQLQEVVARIFRLTKTPFHLIICDNASQQDVIHYLSALQTAKTNVTVIFREDNSYVGPGTNAAVRQGFSPVVVYVCGKEGFVLQEGWETAALQYMEQNPDVGIAGSLVYSPSYFLGQDYPTGIPLFARFRNPHFAKQNPNREFAHVQGGLFALRRSMFDEIGGFSESVPHAYTDVEYSFYVESTGWKLGSIPEFLALFNKTRPSFWHRMHSGIQFIHPPRLDDLPKLDAISSGDKQYCNVCTWVGEEFATDAKFGMCPSCGSNASVRHLVRELASSSLSHRGLKSLLISDNASANDFWRANFAGEILPESRVLSFFQGKDTLPDSTPRLDLIAVAASSQAILNSPIVQAQLERLSHSGTQVVVGQPHGATTVYPPFA